MAVNPPNNISDRIGREARRILSETGLDQPNDPTTPGIVTIPRPRGSEQGLAGAAKLFSTPLPPIEEPVPTPEPVVEEERGGFQRVIGEGKRSFLIRDRDQLLSVLQNIEDNEKRGRNSILMESQGFAPGVIPDIRGAVSNEEQLQLKRDIAQRIVDLTAESEAIPRSQALQRFQDAEDLGSLFSAVGADPLVLLESSASSFAQTLPALAFTVAGTAVAGPAGAAVGGFLGSMNVEQQAAFAQFLAEEGVDLQDPDALLAALADDEQRAELARSATKKGLGVAVTEGVFGAATGGLAKAVAPKKVLREVGGEVVETFVKQSTGRVVGGTLGGTALDIIGEGTGEAAGTALAGRDVSLTDAVRESLSAGPQSGATAVGQVRAEVRRNRTGVNAEDVDANQAELQERFNEQQEQTPTPDTAEELPTPIQFVEGSPDFIVNGVGFSNPSVNLDQEGNPTSVTVTNPQGERRTIGDPELASQVFNRMEDIDAATQETTQETQPEGDVEISTPEVSVEDAEAQVQELQDEQVEATQVEEEIVIDNETTQETTQVDSADPERLQADQEGLENRDETPEAETLTAVEQEINAFEANFALTDDVTVEGSTAFINGEEFTLNSIGVDDSGAPVTATVTDANGTQRNISDPELAANLALNSDRFQELTATDIESDVEQFIQEALVENDRTLAQGILDSFDDRVTQTIEAVQEGREVSGLDIQYTRTRLLEALQTSQDLQDQQVARGLQLELLTTNRALDNARIGNVNVATDQELRDQIEGITADIQEIAEESPVVESFIEEAFDGVADLFFDFANRGEFGRITPDILESVQRQLDAVRDAIPGLPEEFSEGLGEFVQLVQGEIDAVQERVDAEAAVEVADADGDVVSDTPGESVEASVRQDSGTQESESLPESGVEDLEQQSASPDGQVSEVTQEEVVEEPVQEPQEPAELREQTDVPERPTRVVPQTGETVSEPAISEPAQVITPATTEATLEVVNSTIQPIADEIGVSVTVLDNPGQAGLFGLNPNDIHFIDEQGREISAAAVYIPQDERVVFFASALNGENLEADVHSTFAEEIVVHHGLRRLFGDNFITEMAGFYDRMDTELFRDSIELYRSQLRDVDGNPVTATTSQIISGRVQLDENSRALLAEEFFGEAARQDPSLLVPSRRNRLQQGIDSVRSFLSRLGLNLPNDDLQSEIRNLLSLSSQNLRRSVGAREVTQATTRLRQAATQNRGRAIAVRTFAASITDQEQVLILNMEMPPRLTDMLRRAGALTLTKEDNIATIHLVTSELNRAIPNEPVTVSDVQTTQINTNDVLVDNAASEIVNGATTISSFAGVSDTGGFGSLVEVVALFQDAARRLLRERAPAALGKRPPRLVETKRTKGGQVPVTGDVIVSPIVGLPDGPITAGSKIRSTRVKFDTNEGWAPISTPIVTTSVDGRTIVEYRPTPYTFQNAEGRGTAGVTDVESWNETLVGRISDEVQRLEQNDTLVDEFNWFLEVADTLESAFGPIGRIFADHLVACCPVLPTHITPDVAEKSFGRFLTGEFDGELQAYAPYMAYNETQTILSDLRAQYRAVSGKLEDLETARSLGQDSRLTELTEESMRIGGFENLRDELAGEIASIYERDIARNRDRILVDGDGMYTGPMIGNRSTEPLMRAMVNMYEGVDTERGQVQVGGYTDGATLDTWAARALQRVSGDSRIPPVSEAGVSPTQISLIEGLTSRDDMEFLAFAERQLWADNGWISSTDVPVDVVVPNPHGLANDGTVERRGGQVVINDDVNPFGSAIDAIEVADQEGHDFVTIIRPTSSQNPNTRPGLTVSFAAPVPRTLAESLLEAADLSGAVLTSSETESQVDMVSGISYTFLPELNQNMSDALTGDVDGVNASILTAFDVVGNSLGPIVETASSLGIRLSSVDPQFHDALVIHRNDYGKEKTRLTALNDEAVGGQVDQTRRGGEWGVSATQSITNFVNARNEEPNPRSIGKTIGRQARNPDTHQDAMGTILSSMGFGNVSFEGDPSVNAGKVFTTIGTSLKLKDNLPKSRGSVQGQLIDQALQNGFNVQYGRTGAIAINGNGVITIPRPRVGGNESAQISADVMSMVDFLADSITPDFSHPILRADAKLNNMKSLLEDLTGGEIKPRPWSRVYRILMAQELGRSLGLSDDVIRGATFTVQGRKVDDVRTETIDTFDNANGQANGHLNPVNVRFSRRVSNPQFSRTLWMDQGIPRRTPRDLSTAELSSHSQYKPENAATTQRSNTASTYRTIADLIPQNSRVLDYGGGLGAGTQVLRDAGFDTTLFEPFPNNTGRQVTDPDAVALDGSDLDGQFDFITSTFTLNVVPQDTRDHIVRTVGERLNDGGQAIFTVRRLRGDVDRTLKSGKNIDLGNGQVLVSSTGAYQKGFENGELLAYTQDVLGPGFEVSRIKIGNTDAVSVRKLNGLKPVSSFTNIDGRLNIDITPEGGFQGGIPSPAPFSQTDLVGGDIITATPSTVIEVGLDRFSSTIPESVQTLVREFREEFGITAPINVVDVNPERVDEWIKYGVDVGRISLRGTANAGITRERGLSGAYINLEGEHYVYMNPDLYANGDFSSFKTSEVILHELGHVLQDEHERRNRATFVPLNGAHADFVANIQELPVRDVITSSRLPGISRDIIVNHIEQGRKDGKSDAEINAVLDGPFSALAATPEYRNFYNYFTGFDEWFADQFSKYMATEPRERTSNPFHRIFQSLSEFLNRLYQMARQRGFGPHPTFRDFMNDFTSRPPIESMETVPATEDAGFTPTTITSVRFSRRFVRSPQDAANFAQRAENTIRGRTFPDGRPDLANQGRTEVERRFVDLVDEVRNEREEPVRVRIEDVRPQAMQELNADPDGVRDRLLRDGVADADANVVLRNQLMAEEIIQRELGGLDTNDRGSIIRVMTLLNSYRDFRADIARGLAAGHDPTLSPEERNRRYIQHAVFVLPQDLRHRMDMARNKQEIDAVWDAAIQRIDSIQTVLASQGINIHNLTDQQLRDVSTLMQIMRAITADQSSGRDKLYEYWINAILSAPTTHFANIIGNVGNTGWEFFIKRPIEAFINSLPGVQREDSASIGELREFTRALGGAYGPIWSTALRRANLAWDIEAPVLEREVGASGGGMRLDRMSRAIPDTVEVGGVELPLGRLIRVPTRSLLWADEFLKSVTYHMQAASLAFRDGRQQGLSGDRLSSHIAHVLSNPHSEQYQELFARSYAKARTLAFQDPIENKLLRSLSTKDINDGWGSFAIAMFFPFVSTPTNILKQGIKRSPLGIFRIVAKQIKNIGYLRDNSRTHLRYEGHEFISDVAEQIAVSGLVLGLSMMLDQGEDEDPWITGTEADFVTERGELELERRAIPSLSIRLPGTNRYFSYARIEPFATSLAILVDGMNELRSARKNSDGVVDTVTTAAPKLIDTARGLVKDKSFFQGMSNMLDLLFGSGNKVANFTVNTAASFSPNIIRRGLGGLDPYYRDNRIRGEGSEAIQQTLTRIGQKALPIPALQQAAKVDLWGRQARKTPESKMPWSNFVIDFLSPGRLASRDRILPVDRMMRNYIIKHPDSEEQLSLPTLAKDKFTFNGQEVQLDDEQYNEFLTITGQLALQTIQGYPFNIENPTDRDMEVVRNAYSNAREVAKAQMVSRLIQSGQLTFGN